MKEQLLIEIGMSICCFGIVKAQKTNSVCLIKTIQQF
jgi:hypothetical protein